MSWHFIKRGPALYQYEPTGAFYERVSRDGKNSWRKLSATNLKLAKEEMEARRTDYKRSKLGLANDPYYPPQSIGALATSYQEADCPNKRRVPRTGKSLYQEKNRIKHLLKYWGRLRTDDLSRERIEAYADTRFRECKSGTGSRAVDLELHTLSNLLNYATRRGTIKYNPLKIIEWDSFWERSKTRNARDVMPRSGNEVHRLALEFLAGAHQSQCLGWMVLFGALTGLRTNELLRLRTDSQSMGQPGYVDGQYLYLARSKHGVNPWVVLTPELKECIEAHSKWKALRFPKSPWYFPSFRHEGAQPLEISAFTKGMKRVSELICGHQVTPHGLRAFYVTVRRSQGLRDEQVAAEIGDVTVSLISTTYGQIPPNWHGGKELSWIPTAYDNGHIPAPAWTHVFEKSPSKAASKVKSKDLKNTENPCESGAPIRS